MQIFLYHLHRFLESAFSYVLYFSKALFGHFFCSFFIGTLQHFVQKLFETVAFRVGKKFIGRSLFEDFALRHKEYSRAHLSCKSHLVRDDNHRHSLVCNLLYEVKHFAHHFRIESGSRLIKKHDFGIHRKCASNGNPLLLTAAQSRRVNVGFAFKTYAFQKFVRAVVCILLDLLFRRVRKRLKFLFLRMRGVCDFTLDVFDFLSQIELLLCEFGIVSRI